MGNLGELQQKEQQKEALRVCVRVLGTVMYPCGRSRNAKTRTVILFSSAKESSTSSHAGKTAELRDQKLQQRGGEGEV